MCKFFAKLCSYLNGLKDGVLLTMVPISSIIGAIGIVIAIIRNESMRNYVNELASDINNGGSVKYSDSKSEDKEKVKMGFTLE